MRVLFVGVIVVLGAFSSAALDRESLYQTNCDDFLRTIREALPIEDALEKELRIGKVLDYMDGITGIDGCADELCKIASETEHLRLKLVFYMYLCTSGRILYSQYGCGIVRRAVDVFLYPEKCGDAVDSVTTTVAVIVLRKVFRMCKYSVRPIIMYRLVRNTDVKDRRESYFRELGNYLQEMSDSEVFHICSLHGEDAQFRKATACDPIRERFATIKSGKYVFQSREDLLCALQREIEGLVTEFNEHYQDKEVQPFAGTWGGRALPPGL